MAFTIGKYGIGTLLSLGELMLRVYITCFLFVFVVLGLVGRAAGFSLWRFLGYIREEMLHRARHVVVGVGAAADDGEDGATRLRNARWSVW